MNAQLVVGEFNGRPMTWIEMFPNVSRMEQASVVIKERYDLTPDQAFLPIDQLKCLVANGFIKRSGQEGGSK